MKKLVYVYLVRYAEEQQDLALLSISTFQRGLKVQRVFISVISDNRKEHIDQNWELNVIKLTKWSFTLLQQMILDVSPDFSSFSSATMSLTFIVLMDGLQ